MKKFILKYILFIYNNFVEEDLCCYKKWVIPFIKTLWFIKSVAIWILSVVFFPIYCIGMVVVEKIKHISLFKLIENDYKNYKKDLNI